MFSCFWDIKNTENVDSKVLKTENGRTMLSSKCAVSSKKKSRFLRSLVSSLGIKTLFINIPLLGKMLF